VILIKRLLILKDLGEPFRIRFLRYVF